MQYWYGNMMDLINKVEVICVTTNMFTKRNGEAVMGRGIAAQIAKRYPSTKRKLGQHNLSSRADIPTRLVDDKDTIFISFPVKGREEIAVDAKWINNNVVSHMVAQFKPGELVPGWALKADINIIKQSAEYLLNITLANKWQNVYLPKVGCGAGELNWEDVRDTLQTVFGEYSDRFTICDFKGK